MCKYLAFKGAQSNCNAYTFFFSKGPLTSLISSLIVLHISIWGAEAFSGGLSGDGTEFWAPCCSVGPPNLGVWSAADTALFILKSYQGRN